MHMNHNTPHTSYVLYSDDENRITLIPIDENEDCQREYINASYVDVSKE